nr:hypothetical protein [Mycobacterium lepraemurium]
MVAFSVSSVAHPDAEHGIFSATALYSALNAVAAGLIALRACRIPADR